MHKSKLPSRFACVVAIAASMTVLGGCETAQNWLQGRPSDDAADEVILGAPDTNVYVQELFELATGDPATQAEIYADAQAASQLTPSTSTRLRYALVLATPGHPGTDELEAQAMFRELLSQTELMTSGEIALANIHLREVEQRLVLSAETNRLRMEQREIASSEEAAVERRIASMEAENRRLRQSLDEAEQKLEAISSIERSIREQAENGE